MNSSLTIRLIDVALIILLGFIAISRLKTEYIDLTSQYGDTKAPTRKPHMVTVHVYKNYFLVEDGNSNVRSTTREKLEALILNRNETYLRLGEELTVVVQPHKSCLMQDLVNVLDICQRHNITKSLNYESPK